MDALIFVAWLGAVAVLVGCEIIRTIQNTARKARAAWNLKEPA
jgi:hypothetical protein